MTHELSLQRFPAEIPEWYREYTQSSSFGQYRKLEAGLSQKVRDLGYLEIGDLKWITIWGGDEDRKGLGTKILSHNTPEEVITYTQKAFQHLDDPKDAFRILRSGISYLGLTYASKVLRCVCPENYAALDLRTRRACKDLLPEITDMESEMNTYQWYIQICQRLRESVTVAGPRPGGLWFTGDIEMALFQFSLPASRNGGNGKLVA